jgi:DNA (cytosine-5)-methyltransferase 1
MTFGSLFSGIGGLDLGLERAGLRCVWQVEKDAYATRILARHWPQVPRHEEVESFPPRPLRPWRCDLIAGGFPCQPVSCAGRRQGQRDSRWLWPHFARILRILGPEYVLVENVPGLLVRGMGFDEVLGDLASLGYSAEWGVLPACAFGAPSPRERVFVVAYVASERGRKLPEGSRTEGQGEADVVRSGESVTKSLPERCPRVSGGSRTYIAPERRKPRRQEVAAVSHANLPESRIFKPGGAFAALPIPCWGSDQPGLVRALSGVPHRVDRIRGLGNAVVPAVAQWIGERILEYHNGR